MAESKGQASKGPANKESQADRAQSWVVDQAALSILKMGRCPIDVIAGQLGISADTLLAVVQNSDRLTVVDGDLDLCVCNDTIARSLDRWCTDITRAVGCAVHINELSELLTVYLGKTSENIASSIRAAVKSSRSNLLLVGDQILLSDWLPMLGHDDLEDILLENGVKRDLIDALLVKSGRGPFAGIPDFATALLEAIQNKPIRHKTLAVAYWVLTREQNTASDFIQLLHDDRLLWHSGKHGGRWVLSGSEADYRNLVSELVPVPEAPKETSPTTSSDAVVEEREPDNCVKIDDKVVEAIRTAILVHDKCVDVSTYGIPKEHVDDYISVIQEIEGVSPVGFGRLMSSASIPEVNVDSLVSAFSCPRVEFISEDGEQVEDLLSPDSYVGTLKTDVTNPNNQDLLDDEPVGSRHESEERTAFPLYKDHLAHGIIPLCRISAFDIPWDLPYVPVTFVVNGTEHACSIINQNNVRCITGLAGAFTDEVRQSDCLATVTKVDTPGAFTLELEPLIGGEYALTAERCMELDVYKESESDNPTVVILTQILDDHPKGVTFERALRELRYIRRTSVHKLASILSSNDCFAQKPGTGVWRYNPKRADAGNDIARRTYLKSGF